MKITIVAIMALSAVAPAAIAQSVKAPAAANHVAAHAAYTASNVAGTAPIAHEIPAQAVSKTVPATQPFTSSVTAAARTTSVGLRATGNNFQNHGVSVNPTAGVSPNAQYYEKRAASQTVTHVKKTATDAADLNCDAQAEEDGECPN